nr:(-)-germacrene D synthase-like isoform X2 [Ipomoea batatas]
MAGINQPLLALPLSNQRQLNQVTRGSADFHPSVWGDYFLTYSSQPKLINKIQRLGLSYQFEKEIETSLEHIFKAYDEFNDENDLFIVSLRFRLLRQEGYHVSANVFEKFRNSNGKFKESLVNMYNVQAMLSLYEASHLRVHGEQILEEALRFTTSHLESMLPNMTNPLRSQVSEALKQPIHKRLIRLDAQKFISTFEPNGTQDALLLKFAKLDFNLLQKEHQWELGNLTRWDASVVNELPEYMRFCYIYLLDAFAEIEKELADKGESYRVNYARIEMKKLVGAYFDERKWYHDGHNPTFEEYIKLASLSAGYPMLATASLVGMQEDFVTKEVLDWMSSMPLILHASSVMARLLDDTTGHEFEQQREHIDSAVEIYMKEYGKTKEETVKELLEQVTKAWKDINQECLKPTIFPMPILTRILNLTRALHYIYDDKDSYTHSNTIMKDFITSMLVNPIM